MFEEYLQDAYKFLSIAEELTEKGDERGARRYYRASVFYASGAIEAFVNYIADSFAQARNISQYEICFLNDKSLRFSIDCKGLVERSEFHRLDDKIKLILYKFVTDFDLQSITWVKFMEFKDFRDVLVHPRQIDDVTSPIEYRKKVRAGLKAIIEIMNSISKGMFQKPLRKKLIDLIPE